MLKRRASGDDPHLRLSAASYLLHSAQASSQSPHVFVSVLWYTNCGFLSGAVTAVLTNPIWVVKVRMFTTRDGSPTAYRGLWRKDVWLCSTFADDLVIPDGLSEVWRSEGMIGLWKGTSLALVGVSNGAFQFMAYEKMKIWGFDRKRAQFAKAGRTMRPEDEKLVCNILPSSAIPYVDYSSPTPHIP